MPTLTWVGKDKVVNHHHDVPFKVLRPESHFDAPEGSPVNSTGNRNYSWRQPGSIIQLSSMPTNAC